MSRHNAEMIAQTLATQPSLIAAPYAESPNGTDASCVQRALDRLAACDPVVEMAAWEQTKETLSAEYMLATAAFVTGPSSPVQEKPFAYANGLAVIPVHGMLLNRFPYSWGFATGFSFIQSQFAAALDDEDVEMIAFDINSYGGTAAGCEETAQMIFDGRATKPSVALVDSACFSAAYYVASAASRIYSTPSGSVGSIGVLLARPDLTGMLEQAGVKVTMIYAGANKLDTSALVPLSKDAQARLQATVDNCYEMFTAAVARGRGDKMTVAAAKSTEAGCYDAEAAVTAGLIDGVATPQNALQLAVIELMTDDDEDEPNPDDPDEDDIEQNGARNMSLATKSGTPVAPVAAPAAAVDPGAIAMAVQAALTAERERSSAIRNLPEAVGKEKLATKLALDTTLTVDAARGILASAGPDVTQTAAPQTAAGANPLETAMGNQGTPGVQPSGGAANDGAKLSVTEQILAAQDRAQGTNNLAAHRKRAAGGA